MKKAVFLISSLLLISHFSQAQQLKEPKEDKKLNHYVGVQVNKMIDYIFNIDRDNPNINPYTLNYSVNRIKDGWGLNVGVAYDLDEYDETKDTVITNYKVNSVSARIGVEQKIALSDKWLASLGIDFVFANSIYESVGTGPDGAGGTLTKTTRNITTLYGIGPRGSIHYKLGQHVLLGTEANFYYTGQTSDRTITETTSNGSTVTVDNPSLNRLVFSAPIVLMLTVQF